MSNKFVKYPAEEAKQTPQFVDVTFRLFRIITLVSLFILLTWFNLFAQWKNLAPNLINVQNRNGFGSVIAYGGGNIWAAVYSKLWMSSDKGITWESIYTGLDEQIIDIDFLDEFNGIVSTRNSGLLITRDRGLTWSPSKPFFASSYGFQGRFVGTQNNIAASDGQNRFFISHDGGLTWQNISPPNSNLIIESPQLLVRKHDNAICALALDIFDSTSRIIFTTNYGISWQETSRVPYFDCYGFALDPCSDSSFYITNESLIQPSYDGKARLLYSHDGGISFSATNKKSRDYYCGSIICGPSGTLYAQTLNSDGVLRSTDRGITWLSNGGPPGFNDSHTIVCIDDNTIFAIGSDGSIWGTSNSGGDSLSLYDKGKLIFSDSTLFSKDTLDFCDSLIKRFITFKQVGCSPPLLVSTSIQGYDSLEYILGQKYLDSIEILFQPHSVGSFYSYLVLGSSDGTLDTIILKGTAIKNSFAIQSDPVKLFSDDSLYCDSVSVGKIFLKARGCPIPKIVSEVISGLNASDYSIIQPSSNLLVGHDSVTIGFSPSSSGLRSAVLIILFSDGTKSSTILSGTGRVARPLDIITVDQTTDTIGGLVRIPILIQGLDSPHDVEITLHYNIDNNLFYEHTYSPSGMSLDISGEQSQGRSRLRIPKAISNVILGYADFSLFQDTIIISNVWFDSLKVIDGTYPCKYSFRNIAFAKITPPSGCGFSIISRFMRTGFIPSISLYPNPANSYVNVQASKSIGNVKISLYNEFGIPIIMTRMVLDTYQKTIDVSLLASGIYYAWIEGDGFNFCTVFAIKH